MINIIRNTVAKIGAKLQRNAQVIMLVIIYVVGIGPVSILTKILGKQHFILGKKKSTWVKTDPIGDIKKMY